MQTPRASTLRLHCDVCILNDNGMECDRSGAPSGVPLAYQPRAMSLPRGFGCRGGARRARGALRRGIEEGACGEQLTSVGHRHRLGAQLLAPIPREPSVDGDLVAGAELLRGPPGSLQLGHAAELHRPRRLSTLLVLALD